MKCDANTMLKTAAGLAAVAGIIYFTVPAAQAFLAASAPVLIALICPISMLIMMRMMNSNSADGRGEAGNPPRSRESAPEAASEPPREARPVLPPGAAAPLRHRTSAG